MFLEVRVLEKIKKSFVEEFFRVYSMMEIFFFQFLKPTGGGRAGGGDFPMRASLKMNTYRFRGGGVTRVRDKNHE